MGAQLGKVAGCHPTEPLRPGEEQHCPVPWGCLASEFEPSRH